MHPLRASPTRIDIMLLARNIKCMEETNSSSSRMLDVRISLPLRSHSVTGHVWTVTVVQQLGPACHRARVQRSMNVQELKRMYPQMIQNTSSMP
jgi:hypothetical protein